MANPPTELPYKYPTTHAGGTIRRTPGSDGTSAMGRLYVIWPRGSRSGNVIWALAASLCRRGSIHEHRSPALPSSAGVSTGWGRHAAIATRSLRRRRAPPRGGLLRRRKARPDPPVHRLGVCHLATRRVRHRGTLLVGTPLVAGSPHRRTRGQRRAPDQ